MPAARTVPLSWAQRAWLLGPPALTERDGWRHDLTAALTVPQHVDAVEVDAVLSGLIGMFPTLRARLRPDADGIMWQDIAAAAPARACPVSPSLNVIQAAAGARAAVGEDGPNIAAAVQYPAPDTTRITLALAHAYVDGWGTNVVRRMFELALCGADLTTEQSTLFSLLEFQDSAAGAELSRRNIARLVTVAGKAERLGLLPEKADGHSQEHVDLLACVRSVPNGGWLFDVLAALAPSSGMARAAAVLSLVFLGYCRWSGERGALFATPIANRISREQQEFAGLMMMRNWVLLDWRPDETFRELVRRVTTQLLRCALHGAFEPTAALTELERAGLSSTPRLYFNYSEPADFAPPDRAESRPDESSEMWCRLPSGGIPFEFNAYVMYDSVTVIAKYDDTVFADEQTRCFEPGLGRIAALVASAPDTRIGAVCDRV
jgi:hypothetical protein